MARKRKDNGDPTSSRPGEAGPSVGHNSIDAATARAFVARVERLKDDLLSERGSYMARCKTIRAEIDSVLDEAATDGLPRRELKAVVKARELERKADAVREDLEEATSIATFDQIREALGDYADTPLGQAALGRAEASEYRV